MKKVVHLITLLELGGAQGNTIHTVQNLNPQNFETHLWCGEGAYWDAEMKARLGGAGRLRFFRRLVRPIHPIYDLLIVWDLVKAFREFKADVVHTHSSKAGIVGRLAAKLAGVPIVIHTFHGFGFNNEQKPWTKWLYVGLEKWMARYSNALIFVSEANRDEAVALGIGNYSQYHLIRSGVPIDLIRENGNKVNPKAIKKDLGVPDDNKVVITLSAFKPQKNLLDFLRVAKEVKQKFGTISFLLVGDGDEREKLEAWIQGNHLENTVKLLGWRKDTASLLAASDIFVLTSLWEGLPRAMVEALILGKPCVCYQTDGVKDLLRKGGGYLVDQHDVSKFSERILELLKHPDVYASFSSQAKALITKEFDIDEMVVAQERLYEALLALNHS